MSDLNDKSELEKKPREFQPIENPEEARGLLREGTKTLSSIILWTKDPKRVINTHMSVFEPKDKTFHCWIPKDMKPELFMDELAQTGSADCYFSVSLTTANIFFKAKYMGFDAGGLRFQEPTRIFKVQRRSDARFPIPDGLVIRVELQDPLFPELKMSKKVLDISASGMAIVVADNEAPLFHEGLILKDVNFSVRNRKIKVDAEVRHTKQLPSDSRNPGIKIGILFKNIREADSQWLAGYVFEESRKYLSKFL